MFFGPIARLTALMLLVGWGCNDSNNRGDGTASFTDSGSPGDGSPGDGSPGDGSPGDGSPGDGSLDRGVVADARPGDDWGSAGEPTPLPTPPATASVKGAIFATSPVCKDCHSAAAGSAAFRDAAGRNIGPFELWQSSMMANAARDPLWRAVVSAEVADTPAAAEIIEAKCLSCHSPGGYREGMQTIAGLSEASTLGQLSRDGVTCTVCHQIDPQNLGQDDSFTAGWIVGDQKRIYGPHADPFAMPMTNDSGYTPVQGDHMTQSALCGTCHTVQTDTLTADAQPTGHTLVEQATFLEWRNSRYAQDGPTCQGCHVPTMDADGQLIRTVIARRPNDGGDFPGRRVGPRAPVGRHVFVGANTLVPRILRDFGAELATQAPAAAFDVTIDAARAMLRSAAEIEIAAAVLEGDHLAVPITVLNRTGHKLPSGIPTRRVWLRVTAYDADDGVIFESGAWNEDGQLVAMDGQPLPSELHDGPVLSHSQVVDTADQVQVYASQMCDADGAPTWRLLRGATYCEDDRLLPEGWSANHPDGPRTDAIGVGDDPDFLAGGDTTVYHLPVTAVRVDAKLVHQALDARFAAELFRFDTPEVRALRYYLLRVPVGPELIDDASRAL